MSEDFVVNLVGQITDKDVEVIAGVFLVGLVGLVGPVDSYLLIGKKKARQKSILPYSLFSLSSSPLSLFSWQRGLTSGCEEKEKSRVKITKTMVYMMLANDNSV